MLICYRVAHSTTNYIAEKMLDSFLDFILWGHEHECLIAPQESAEGEFVISQPGSSVATSLSEGESKKKHIGLLEIDGDRYRLKPIPLRTVRPLVMKSIVLQDEPKLEGANAEALMDYLEETVNTLIEEARQLSSPKDATQFKPLIRVRVDHTGFPTCHPQRFGQRFFDKVANPEDILLFHRQRQAKASAKSRNKRTPMDVDSDLRPDPLDAAGVMDLIGTFLQQHNLGILPDKEMCEAITSFAEKDNTEAISRYKSLFNNTKS
jgi:double-strand break repair protein MRE11